MILNHWNQRFLIFIIYYTELNIFNSEKLTFIHNVFYEEIFELIAYGVLLRAGSLLVQNEVSGISADSAENIGNSGFDR